MKINYRMLSRFAAAFAVAGLVLSCKPEIVPGEDDDHGDRGPVEVVDPDEPEEADEPDFDPSVVTDLSAEETANCYIVPVTGRYKLNARVRGNGLGTIGLFEPTKISPDDAALLWQSSKGMITDVTLDDGYITFTASKVPGNAVITALKDGEIVWSWHIWHPGVEVKGLPTATGYELMDLNLGATNKGDEKVDVNTFGLLYQWGRKDPFPGSPALTGDEATMPRTVYDSAGEPTMISFTSWTSTENNTLAYSVAHPKTVVSSYSQYSTCTDWLRKGSGNDELWGSPKTDDKTYFDPCPAGWRVPPADVFSNVTTTGKYEDDVMNFNVADANGDGYVDADDFNYGWIIYLDRDNDVKTFVPAASRYDGYYGMFNGMLSGFSCNLWSRDASTEGLAISPLYFQKTLKGKTNMSPEIKSSRADAFSVRCIRDLK